ncbi:MAG: hypothetical protein UV38_C0002G0098 [candidate division TM6 bacterium GW2011_GWE2_42_60]|nr:MAG: hypothetical protein UV38_C0002G0098 [candidate division TM6 bacterium GW2011_GWE2_42_60]HBY06144.1 hypothetical protein [Candidatus Dependentiae bacterium]
MIMKILSKKLCLALILLTVGVVDFLQAEVVRDYKLSQKEERIQGKRFIHRKESDLSKSSEAWVIDGASVPKERFEESYLEAKKEELRAERAQEQLLLEQEEQSNLRFRRAILQKLLRAQVEECRAQVAIIERNELDAYMVFSAATIKDSATYVELVQERLGEALRLVSQGDADIVALQKEEQDLTESCSRLKAFVRATIDRAIEQCTDTKLLKKLLNDVE